MSRHNSCRCETDPATGLVVRECARCLRAIAAAEDERDGLTDPTGSLADAAADDYYLGSE